MLACIAIRRLAKELSNGFQAGGFRAESVARSLGGVRRSPDACHQAGTKDHQGDTDPFAWLWSLGQEQYRQQCDHGKAAAIDYGYLGRVPICNALK